MAVKKRGRRGGRASTRKDEIKAPNISDETRLKETKDKKALVVAQEIKIARLLANNDKKVRDKVLKRLHKWLTVRSQSSFGKLTCSVMWIMQLNISECKYSIFHVFHSVHESRLHELVERPLLLYVAVGQNADPRGPGRVDQQTCTLLEFQGRCCTLH